jgi:hypothetical protein
MLRKIIATEGMYANATIRLHRKNKSGTDIFMIIYATIPVFYYTAAMLPGR